MSIYAPLRLPDSDNGGVKISAKAEYAVRAALELAAHHERGPRKADEIAHPQDIPPKFLEAILLDLRHGGVVKSQRGAAGGYWLAQAPDQITIADVIRAVDGPLAYVRGERPEQVAYSGSATHLPRVWIALRAAIRDVLEITTLADILTDDLPQPLLALVTDPDAWAPH